MKPGVNGATIVCRSGIYFDFAAPTAAMLDIGDIAWGLSNLCRFAGQCTEFYSVAQHSVLVSEIVPPDMAFDALMHDAAEAYTGDMVAPLKQLLPGFKEIEKRVEAVIAERFRLRDIGAAEIKHADLRLLRTEQRDLTAGADELWERLEGYEPLDAIIRPMPPEEAYAAFIDRYLDLQSQRA